MICFIRCRRVRTNHGTGIRLDFDEVSLKDRPAHGACTLVRRSKLMEVVSTTRTSPTGRSRSLV